MALPFLGAFTLGEGSSISCRSEALVLDMAVHTIHSTYLLKASSAPHKNVISKFIVLFWVEVIAILAYMLPVPILSLEAK